MSNILGLVAFVAFTLFPQFIADAANRTLDCDTGATIQSVVNRLRPGDILLVSGTCNENLTIPVEVQGITLDGQDTATINGPDPNRPTVTIKGPGVTIKGFTITGGDTLIIDVDQPVVVLDSSDGFEGGVEEGALAVQNSPLKVDHLGRDLDLAGGLLFRALGALFASGHGVLLGFDLTIVAEQ